MNDLRPTVKSVLQDFKRLTPAGRERVENWIIAQYLDRVDGPQARSDSKAKHRAIQEALAAAILHKGEEVPAELVGAVRHAIRAEFSPENSALVSVSEIAMDAAGEASQRKREKSALQRARGDLASRPDIERALRTILSEHPDWTDREIANAFRGTIAKPRKSSFSADWTADDIKRLRRKFGLAAKHRGRKKKRD